MKNIGSIISLQKSELLFEAVFIKKLRLLILIFLYVQLNRKKANQNKKSLSNKPNQPQKNNPKQKGKRCCLATASFKWSEIGVFAGIWEISHRACQVHGIRKGKN